MTRASAVATSAVALAASFAGAAERATVPLCAGLTIVTAISQPEGDYESIKTVESIDGGLVRVRYSAERPEGFAGTRRPVRKYTVSRVLPIADLESATLYLQQFHEQAPSKVPGTTALGTSAAVLRALKAKGASELGIFGPLSGPLSADPQKHPSVYDYRVTGTARRDAAGPATLPLLVNGAPLALPVVVARADFEGDKAEFLFLDDERNPLALRFRIGIGAVRPRASAGETRPRDRDTLDVVKIAYRCAGPAAAVGAPRVSRIEEALEKAGRVEVYDLHFSFDSDAIRDESKPTLDEIGAVLRRHPEWKLSIEGHTDSIAGDQYNLDLSRRRASAVKRALTDGYGVDGARLATAGFGEGSPRDTNDTLEGRARNRRVELIRRP